MAKEDIIRPQSRLDANTVAKSRAIDAQRGAVNAERQAMQNERSLQRQYRRAIRKGDIGKAGQINELLLSTGGSTIGPVIRKAEEERMVAGQRAIDRANQLNKIRQAKIDENAEEEGNKPDANVNEGNQKGANELADDATKTANPRSNKGAGYGKPVKKESDQVTKAPSEKLSTVGTSSKAEVPPEAKTTTPSFSDPKQSFYVDLERSKLFNEGDSDAIERAVNRGAKLGISREDILSQKPTEGNVFATTLASPPPDTDSSLSEQVKKSVSGLKGIGDQLDSITFSEPLIYGPKSTDKQTPDFVRTPVKKSTVSEPLISDADQIENQQNKNLSQSGLSTERTNQVPVFSSGMTITSREEKEARLAKEYRASQAEPEKIKEEIIRKKINDFRVPDWQRDTIIGGIHSHFAKVGIRAERNTLAMEREVDAIIESQKALLDVKKENVDFSESVSKLLSTQ